MLIQYIDGFTDLTVIVFAKTTFTYITVFNSFVLPFCYRWKYAGPSIFYFYVATKILAILESNYIFPHYEL